jgi:alkylation response protein AidB-like acyl-CoA dehydrogenase
MFSLHLSSEQIEIRDAVRGFVERELKPAALEPRRLEAFDKPLLEGLLAEASRMGLRTLALSEEAGGAGADALTCCIVTEELAAGDPDIAAVLAHTAALAGALERLMTPAQRERFLPQFVRDEGFHLAFVDGEPQSALGPDYHRPVSPVPGGRIEAGRSGDMWIVNGVATCVANAPLAGLFAVRVRTSSGVRVLLVRKGTKGLAVRAPEGRWFHGACGDVVLEHCRVPPEDVLGADAGLRNGLLAQTLALGIGRAAHDAALDYAKLRVQGGRRIVEHQAIGAKLAGIAVGLEVARAAVWRAAWASDHPEAVADRSLPDLPLETVAEAFTAGAVLEAVKDAAECFGAMGVMRDMPLHKYVHDARVCLYSGPGATEAKLRLAEALAGFRREAQERATAEATGG